SQLCADQKSVHRRQLRDHECACEIWGRRDACGCGSEDAQGAKGVRGLQFVDGTEHGFDEWRTDSCGAIESSAMRKRHGTAAVQHRGDLLWRGSGLKLLGVGQSPAAVAFTNPIRS